MSVNKDFIFESSGWDCNKESLINAEKILFLMKTKRKNKDIPIFSLLDSDDDIKKIIDDTKFFLNIENTITDFILIGTGGSSLGANALIKANINNKSNINFHILDSLDPVTIKSILEKISPNTAKFLVISKSGKTTEIIALMLIVMEWLKNNKVEPKKAIMSMFDFSSAIESPIAKISSEYGIKITEHQSNIGGRFAALSSTGLLPACIMGIDPMLLRRTSRKTLNSILSEDSSFILSSSIFSNPQINKNKLNCVINYGDSLSEFLLWYRQLWNESLGKDGEGTFLLTARGSVDQHSQLQMWLDGPNNGLYTFLNIKNSQNDFDVPFHKSLSSMPKITSSKLLDVMSQATYQALKNRGRPVRSITIEDISVVSTASLMVTFILEVLLVAELLKINPYSQDAVEDIKINTLRKLDNYESN